ncbi:MAG: hypothetical protein AAFQ45_09225 [Pseudomonadota bacterium]
MTDQLNHQRSKRSAQRAVLAGLAISLGVAAVLVAGSPSRADKRPAWGTADDVAFAKTLWPKLVAARLVGPDRLMPFPQKGEAPHGVVQQILAGTVDLDGAKARVVVKANHRGDGLTPGAVYRDPNAKVTGYAVMAKRKAGYAPKHADWFWAVFETDGAVRVFNAKPIAGRVDTGKSNGCIGCHVKKGGRDLETLTGE